MEKTEKLVRGIVETVCNTEGEPTVNVDEIVTAIMNDQPLPEHPEQDEDVMGYIKEAMEETFDRYQPDENAQWMRDAPKIPVKVAGREYQTYMDKANVQRFVESSVISTITENMGRDEYNQLFVDYLQGKFSLEEWMDFMTSTGYSVSAFSGLNDFCHLPIENPLWNKNK